LSNETVCDEQSGEATRCTEAERLPLSFLHDILHAAVVAYNIAIGILAYRLRQLEDYNDIWC
jgi:hypothetical protein